MQTLRSSTLQMIQILTLHYQGYIGLQTIKTIINFKKRILSFEDEEIRVVSPIDPFEGQRYVQPIYNEGQVDYLDQIYNVTAMHEDHISPTADGNLSWKSTSSYTSDSGEALENWQNRLHEVSMRRCARVTRSMRRVETKSRELPTYENFIYPLDMEPKTWDNSEQLRQGTQQVTHTVPNADKHPIIHSTIQQDRGVQSRRSTMLMLTNTTQLLNKTIYRGTQKITRLPSVGHKWLN